MVDLAEEVEACESATRYHFKEMLQEGLVERETGCNMRDIRLYITMKGEELLDDILGHDPNLRRDRVYILSFFVPRINEVNRPLYYYDDNLDEFIKHHKAY
jgi:DNA-binding MarR family transcriptional regulator